MERYEDIQELLVDIDKKISELGASYKAAQLDEERLTVLRPLIKSVASDLRSILDYSAHTIYEQYSTKEFTKYFPCGEDKQKFIASVNKNLNGLEIQRPDLYSVVESIQPHIAGDPWLYTLCKITNVTKHKELGKQQRVNSGLTTTNVGGFVNVGGGSITIRNTTYNGVLIGKDKPIVISSDRKIKEIEADFNIPIKGYRAFDKVSFELVGFDVDALLLLSTARDQIKIFAERLRAAIDTK